MADTQSPPDPSWWIFRNGDEPHDHLDWLPPAPPWRSFSRESISARGQGFKLDNRCRDIVNTAIYLRRPLLVLGLPGVGKTTLAYAIARQLGIEPVLRWSIDSRTTLADGLYSYDAIGRLQASSPGQPQQSPGTAPAEPPIEHYLQLGPLGTALAPAHPGERSRPRLLLIDEIDKSDIDLPNDLLHVFEEGTFNIPELERLGGAQPVNIRGHDHQADADCIPILNGKVECEEFPIVVMTSNGEREFPGPFLRRCLPLKLEPPEKDDLMDIIEAKLGGLDGFDAFRPRLGALVDGFIEARKDAGHLATDQLLHALFLALTPQEIDIEDPVGDKPALIDQLWQRADGSD